MGIGDTSEMEVSKYSVDTGPANTNSRRYLTLKLSDAANEVEQ
jgi:hypothetical protein